MVLEEKKGPGSINERASKKSPTTRITRAPTAHLHLHQETGAARVG